MALSRLTKITGPGVSTDTNWVGNNANFTGITTTATSFNIGVTTIHSTLIESHNIVSTGVITATGGSFSGNVTAVDGTFSGNVSIAGTLTYEDVTNIDAVGIITAPALDVDDFLDVGSNIKLGNAGVITATTFKGDGDFVDIDVDGHTNLDNVSIAGISTFSGILDATNTPASIRVAQDIQHKGDADTKITFPANDTISFDTAGNERLRIDAGGGVQVGTSTATASKVTVYGANDAAVIFQGSGTGTGAANGFLVGNNGGTDGLLWNYENGNTKIATNNVERLRITSGGQVVIGDDDTDKANGHFDDLIVGANASTTETHGITIVCGNAATNGGIAFSDGSNGGADAYRGMISYQHNDNHMHFRTNSVEKLRINSDGKIGIATDTGNGLINTRHGGTNQQVLHVRADLGSSNNRSINLYTPDTDNASAPFRFQTGNGYLFQCDNENVFTIAHDRRVGIMSATPTEALEVRGNIFCRGATTSDKPRIKFGFTNGVIQGGKTEGNVGQDYLAISADGGTTDHFVVDYGGNVGISSINPQRPLDVRGEVLSNKFTARSQPVSSYTTSTAGYKFGARGSYALSVGGSRSSNGSSFTMFELRDFNNSKYFDIEISFHHAGGGIHGSYRRFAGICNGYTSIQTLHDTGNVNVGGGGGFGISKPDNHTLRVTWNGASGYADNYALYCLIHASYDGTYFSYYDSAFY